MEREALISVGTSAHCPYTHRRGKGRGDGDGMGETGMGWVRWTASRT
jgi:hypothetical protein